MSTPTANPLDPSITLKRPPPDKQLEEAHPPQPIYPEDSAMTKAEKVERNGPEVSEEPSAKRIKLDTEDVKDEISATLNGEAPKVASRDNKGIAMIKAE